MTLVRRFALRLVGAAVAGIGFVFAASSASSVVLMYAVDASCAPGDGSCGNAGPLFLRLAMVPMGFGVLVGGLGLLLRRAAVEGFVAVVVESAALVRTAWQRARAWR